MGINREGVVAEANEARLLVLVVIEGEMDMCISLLSVELQADGYVAIR